MDSAVRKKYTTKYYGCKLCGFVGKQVEGHFKHHHPNTPIAVSDEAVCLNCGAPTGYSSIHNGFKAFCNKSCAAQYRFSNKVNAQDKSLDNFHYPIIDNKANFYRDLAAPVIKFKYHFNNRIVIQGKRIDYLLGTEDNKIFMITEAVQYWRRDNLEMARKEVDSCILQTYHDRFGINFVFSAGLDNNEKLPYELAVSDNYNPGCIDRNVKKHLDNNEIDPIDQGIADSFNNDSDIAWYFYKPIKLYTPERDVDITFLYKYKDSIQARIRGGDLSSPSVKGLADLLLPIGLAVDT